MTINQAFEILQNSGGIRAARLITSHYQNLGRFRVWRIARQLRRGVPVAKIIHEKWFYALPFYTNHATLDPRPDTETLVSAVLADYAADCAPRVLDIGTGTGCILAAIVHHIPRACGVGIDKSHGAVRVARRNMRTLGLNGRTKILWRDFSHYRPGGTFDVIVSNPPYIARGDTRVNRGAHHDPAMALYADDNGLAAYKMIAPRCLMWLRTGGRLYLEIGDGQAQSVTDIFTAAGLRFIRSEKDLAGIKRVLVFEKN